MGTCHTRMRRGSEARIGTEHEQTFQTGEKKCKPILIENGLNVRYNPHTRKLEGMPEEWVTKFKIPHRVDRKTMVSTKNFRKEIKPDNELPASIISFIDQHMSTEQGIFEEDSELPMTQSHLSGIANNEGMDSKLSRASRNKSMMKTSHLTSQSLLKVKNNPKESSIIMSILSNMDSSIKVNSKELQILSSEEFQQKIKKVKFIQDHPSEQFIFKQEIGSGAVCKVFRAVARYSPGQIYAVRIMKEKEIQNLSKIRCEIAVMELCSSPNIVQYHFTYYYLQTLFMFIEFMDAGSLTGFIRQYKKKIPERIIAYILKGVLKGLSAIHSHHQIHRDVKSDNIMLNKNGQIKIADFGYAMQLTAEKGVAKGLAGTAAWMAPELIRKEDYDQMVDIWSLGILVFQLCEGQPPNLGLPSLKAMYKIASEEPPKINGFSAPLTDFLSCCLRKNPSERWTADQLLKHPFITSLGSGNSQKSDFKKMLSKCIIATSIIKQ